MFAPSKESRFEMSRLSKQDLKRTLINVKLSPEAESICMLTSFVGVNSYSFLIRIFIVVVASP